MKFESNRTTGTYGTDPDLSSELYSDFVFTDVSEVSINPSNEFLTAPSSTRDGDRTALGAFKLGGSIKTVADCYMTGYWLYGALGTCQADKIDTKTGTYAHLFYPVQGRERLPSWYLVHGLDGKLENVYTGVAMKSISLSAAKGGLLEISTDVMCQSMAVGAWGAYSPGDESSVTLNDDANIMSFVHGIITKVSGEDKPIESFDVTINNNPDDDWFILGSRFLQGVHENDRTIEGSISISVQDEEEIKRFLAGGQNPTATTPGSTYTPFTLELVFNTGTEAYAADSVNFQLGMYFPEVVYNGYTLSASTRNRLTYDVSFKALKGAPTWLNGTITGSQLPVGSGTSYDDEVVNTPLLAWLVNARNTDYAGVAAE